MRGRAIIIVGTCALAGVGAPAAALADGVPPGVIQGGQGIAAAAGDVRYVAIDAGSMTAVAAVRTGGGAVVRSRTLPGPFGVPMITLAGATDGLSADGRTLVLEVVRRALPVRAASRFAILSTRGLRVRAMLRLPGDFSFDALSPDARTLYLVEHTAEGDSSRYRVRSYDVASRRLDPRIITDPREPDEIEMAGYPVARTAQADGGWVYTLYQRPNGQAFVHALDTRRATARCIDLPWTGRPDLSGVRLLVDGRGSLAVVRERAVRIALIDGRTFALRAAPTPGGDV
jgi:hypothetical protein